MKFFLVIVLFYLVMPNLSAQKIFWSEMSREDVMNAIEACKSITNLLMRNEYTSISTYLADDIIYAGGNSWMDREVFKEKIISLTNDEIFKNTRFTGYQFDDFLDQYEGNDLIGRIYPVFDNHSVLVRMDYQSDGSYQNTLFVFKKIDNQMILVGLDGFDISKSNSLKNNISGNDYRMEKISQAGITLPVPKDFSGPDKSENQIIFYLKGETDRDAVFQVLIDELKTKIHYYTYKFVEFSNQQYDLSDLTVRYFPYGIIFEYVVIDSYGTKNKGITVGMSGNDRMIIIQFYAFYDIYQKRKEEINLALTGIKR